MAKNRVTPEAGTLVEYATNHSTPIEVLYAKRFQVYHLIDNTYRIGEGQTFDLSSDAFGVARWWRDRGYTVKVYDAIANKWISIPR